jgi:hypothetical protein
MVSLKQDVIEDELTVAAVVIQSGKCVLSSGSVAFLYMVCFGAATTGHWCLGADDPGPRNCQLIIETTRNEPQA